MNLDWRASALNKEELKQITYFAFSFNHTHSHTHLHTGTRAEGSNVERRVSSSFPNLKIFGNAES